MALLLVNVSKAFGIAGIIAVAVNTFAYFRIHRKKFAPIKSTLDESQEVLANFFINKDDEDGGFFFAISTTSTFLDGENCSSGSSTTRERNVMDEGENQSILLGSKPDKPSSNFEVETDNTDATTGKVGKERMIDDWEFLNPEQMIEKEQTRRQPPFVPEQESRDLTSIQSYDGGDQEVRTLLLSGNEKNFETSNESTLHSPRIGHEGEVIPVTNNTASMNETVDRGLVLAKATNATVLSMDIDWSRIMPEEPLPGAYRVINDEALERYRLLIEKANGQGMRVMLTLCSKAIPGWASEYGGWLEEKTIYYFVQYARSVVNRLYDLVEFWITFSDPHMFALMACCRSVQNYPIQRAWRLCQGGYKDMLSRMMAAHREVYDLIHEQSMKTSKKVSVGVSQCTSFVRPYGFFDIAAVEFSEWKAWSNHIENVSSKLDFIGINYYGQQFVSLNGPKVVKYEEYGEDGMAIYPDGLYRILLNFYERYQSLNVPFIITANGIVDSTDNLRKPYILEHLLAIKAAMDKGVPVKGYCFYQLVDCDKSGESYAAKCGLSTPDYANVQKCIYHPSYFLFSEVAKTGIITREQRERVWAELQNIVAEGKNRNISYHVLLKSGAGQKLLNKPFVKKDWRFGHYTSDGLQDPLSKTVKFIFRVPFNAT
eukprot:TRINITY_DN536_c0_g1_i11.p1 TRINITY_DN536_c0_g1~~TRINITY_DN536_c0_g1_i11.p1  ORF type:complete len:655 (+),score=110.57 TRINITY_DN536_c0_g1_i11:613-2577(+)